MNFKTYADITKVCGKLTNIVKENPYKKTVIGKDNNGKYRLGAMADAKTAICFERNNAENAQATLDEFGDDAKTLVTNVLAFVYDLADITDDKELMALYDDVTEQIKDCK